MEVPAAAAACRAGGVSGGGVCRMGRQGLGPFSPQTLLSCLAGCCGRRWDNLHEPVHIVMVGKYTVLSDAYLSVLKALQHACMAAGLKLKLTWVEAQYLEPEAKEEQLEKYEESWKQVWGCLDRARGAAAVAVVLSPCAHSYCV